MIFHPPPILSIADFIADPVEAAAFPAHTLRWRNDRAAAEVGLATLDDAGWIDHFGLFVPLGDNLPQPLALRYHGHQFGSYNPDLGDGRGFLFAQLRGADGRLFDLGTKGSGQTPWSRFGDGRLTLKGAVRELLATELLEALGVPTSRTMSIIETGEALHRGDEPSPTRSAVMVRLNHSHIRIGSFQRLAHIGDAAAMERLLRYCLAYYCNVPGDTAATMPVDTAAAMLVTHTARMCARTVASYMVAGFVHGVLNTDNILITGESFDYGPWRFAPTWDPGFTAAYFDHAGRYAFGHQPQVLHWNVGQLAVALRLIAAAQPLIDALEAFAPAYEAAIAERFCWRLGVTPRDHGDADDTMSDRALVIAAERFMRGTATPIDQFYIDWHGGRGPRDRRPIKPDVTAGAGAPTPAEVAPDDLPDDVPDAVPGALADALATALAGRAATRADWWETAPGQSLLIEEVETLWAAIAERDDWAPLYAKVAAIRAMGAALR